MRVETVVIQTENGPVVINKSDFDEKAHKLYVEKKTSNKKKKADDFEVKGDSE